MSIKAPIPLVAVAVLLSVLGATDLDGAGINTSRSDIKNTPDALSMESSGAHAARDEIPSRRAHGEASNREASKNNRGYCVGSGGVARKVDTPASGCAQPVPGSRDRGKPRDIGVNEPGIN